MFKVGAQQTRNLYFRKNHAPPSLHESQCEQQKALNRAADVAVKDKKPRENGEA